MSSVRSFLESLHSALIDELNDRHPEIKPELGLPKSGQEWTWPTSEPGALLLTPAFVERSRLVAAILFDQTAAGALGYSPEQLWAKLLPRAESEFKHRGIAPVVEKPVLFCYDGSVSSIPHECEEITRQIWIPMRVDRLGSCWLGMGIVRPQTVH